jgi:hypothetical protein
VQKTALPVIPAKAGIQFEDDSWTPAFAGVTTGLSSATQQYSRPQQQPTGTP